MRELTRDDVMILVHCLPEEDMPLRGNVMASGDNDLDRECEDDIQRQLDEGNEWAWCCIRVMVTWADWEAEEYLGGCSYANEAAFRADVYFADMVDTALGRLNETIQDADRKLGVLR